MSSECNPSFGSVLIKPFFVKEEDWTKHDFVGVSPEDEGLDEDHEGLAEEVVDSSRVELELILDVLNYYFGVLELMNYDSNLIKGLFMIETLSQEQINVLKKICTYTVDYPTRYGPSYLKFRVVTAKQRCDCKTCNEDGKRYSEFEDDYMYGDNFTNEFD